MNNLNLGSVKIPINAATKTFAVLAKRGAGKTWTGAVMAEEFAKANIPFVVFDPIDVWWGLRLSINGKDKGLPIVVFGVEHADIKLDREMGRKIAQEIVKNNISCVISTFGLPKVAQRHLITEFSEELLNINNTPRHIFIEEAHEYVPQRVFGGLGKTFNAVSNLVVMGRNRGIGVTMINQRAATINKDVLTQLDTLLAFQNNSPQDRKALQDWVEYHSAEGDFDKFMKSLPFLKHGKGWIWSPEFMGILKPIEIRKRETFHPDREKIDSKFVMPELGHSDVQSFIERFTSQLKTMTPTKGKTKKGDLQPIAAIPVPIPVVESQQLIQLRNEYESKLIQKDGEIRSRDAIIENIKRIIGGAPVAASESSVLSSGKNNSLIESLPNYEKAIMEAIKQHPNIPFTRSQLAIKAGRSYTSSAYLGAINRLIKLQLITKSGSDLIYQS